MYLCKQYITTITISFIIIIAVLEPKLINNIKQSHDHRVISIIPILVHENPPWLNAKTTFKSEANPWLNQQHFTEIRSLTSEYSTIYTDGSNDGDMVASAAIFEQQVYSLRLPSASSIFIAEANAMRLALKFVASSDESKFIISSNTLPCMLAIKSWPGSQGHIG